MIIGANLPNIPWQDRPAGCTDVVWRYSENPIIERHAIPSANSVFNSAVIAKDGAFVGIFRSDSRAMEQQLFLGKSNDAIHCTLSPIRFLSTTKRESSSAPQRAMTRVCARLKTAMS